MDYDSSAYSWYNQSGHPDGVGQTDGPVQVDARRTDLLTTCDHKGYRKSPIANCVCKFYKPRTVCGKVPDSTALCYHYRDGINHCDYIKRGD